VRLLALHVFVEGESFRREHRQVAKIIDEAMARDPGAQRAGTIEIAERGDRAAEERVLHVRSDPRSANPE